jgi:hypothetical protein
LANGKLPGYRDAVRLDAFKSFREILNNSSSRAQHLESKTVEKLFHASRSFSHHLRGRRRRPITFVAEQRCCDPQGFYLPLYFQQFLFFGPQ